MIATTSPWLLGLYDETRITRHAGGDQRRHHRESYDGYGRLLSVTEGSGANGADITASYGYDVGNRLHSVSTTDNMVTQTRTFNYDPRGLLLSEQHPESGQTVYGPSAAISAYDARGHATRKVVGSQDLRFVYDSAERLTEVQAASPNGTLSTLKTFTYGGGHLGTCPAISGCEARNGKLVTAVRHNLDPLFGDVTVTESYAYYGRSGRMAERNTAVSSAGGFEGASFVTRRSWNELGLLDTIDYPTTSFAGQARYVGYSYDQGILSAVNGYGTVTYQPSGVVATVAHTNGVTEVWDPDARGMARIRATSGAQTLWDSGSYAYDGAGNIATIGPGRFRYDKVGRLTFESSPYPEAFYSYDAFGNRTGSIIPHVNGDVFGRVTTTVPLDPQTNRLQDRALRRRRQPDSMGGGRSLHLRRAGHGHDAQRLREGQPGAAARWDDLRMFDTITDRTTALPGRGGPIGYRYV